MLDYLRIIETESSTFAEALRPVPDDIPVPSCPDWTALDLLWHLAEVQGFWSRILAGRARTDADAESADLAGPERPPTRGEVAALQLQHTRDLLDVLATSDPAEPAWSWFEPDQTVGFTLRRQAHEALVHRVDAELTAAGGPLPLPPTPIDPELAADGVHELVTRFWGVPDWGEFSPASGVVALIANDTGDRWFLRVGRLAGTTPSGRRYQGHTAELVEAARPAATVTGSAADIDLWLWGRGPAPARSGDPGLLEALDEVIEAGID